MSAATGIRVRSRGAEAAATLSPPAEPAVLCILGASGDLAQGKLVPALVALGGAGALPERFAVVGCARGLREDDLRARFASGRGSPRGARLADAVHACAGDFEDPGFYAALAAQLRALERVEGGPGPEASRIFYLATPPGLFPAIVEHLTAAGLLDRAGGGEPAPRRLVIEKPFGRDLASARALNRFLAARLGEDQIFRIDHYLAKDTVQNILVLRCANLVFEPLWRREHVDHVQITVAESAGVAGRGSFYDRAGVVRDIFQSHLLALLTLVAMEVPVSFAAADVRPRKLDVLRALRPLERGALCEQLVLGQYDGYRAERGVDPRSRTPTYVAQALRVDNWRWQGVPFYLRAGKALAAKRTEISLVFRDVPHCLFDAGVCQRLEPNVLTLRIQPAEGVHLAFTCKEPGDRLALAGVDLDMGYADAFERRILGAYERVLLDVMRGDQALFMRSDEVEEAWRLVEPLLAAAGDPEWPLAPYRAGSAGPEASEALLARSGRRWIPLPAPDGAERP